LNNTEVFYGGLLKDFAVIDQAFIKIITAIFPALAMLVPIDPV
jgi:hypothetical protein